MNTARAETAVAAAGIRSTRIRCPGATSSNHDHTAHRARIASRTATSTVEKTAATETAAEAATVAAETGTIAAEGATALAAPEIVIPVVAGEATVHHVRHRHDKQEKDKAATNGDERRTPADPHHAQIYRDIANKFNPPADDPDITPASLPSVPRRPAQTPTPPTPAPPANDAPEPPPGDQPPTPDDNELPAEPPAELPSPPRPTRTKPSR